VSNKGYTLRNDTDHNNQQSNHLDKRKGKVSNKADAVDSWTAGHRKMG